LTARLRQSQIPQLSLAGLQTFGDLAQRFGLHQLTEPHRHELFPTGKATGVPLRCVLIHRRLKAVARHQLQNLAEDAAYCSRAIEFVPGRFVVRRLLRSKPHASGK
jgi:hypothetical protein